MKKIICLLFISILTGCGLSSNFNYELDTLKEEVISAEIVEVIDDVDKEIKINTLNLIGVNDLEKMLTELSNLQFIWTKVRPHRADGECLKLNYEAFEAGRAWRWAQPSWLL